MRPSLRLGDLARQLREAGLLLEQLGDQEVEVRGAAQDSRAVEPGEIFLAWSGGTHDAHDFAPAAIARGALAVVGERALPDLDVPQLVVSEGRRAAALVADRAEGSPWREFFLCAVTGTNGKTTTTYLTRALLGLRGRSAAIGTLGLIGPDGNPRPGSEALTTPGPVQLSRWLRSLVEEGVDFVTMEVSSHALDQHRVDGNRFEVGVFTNVTQDHLDYHATLDEYVSAKTRLASMVGERGTLVVNADDRAWGSLFRDPRTLSFAVEGEGDLRAEAVEGLGHGTRFRLAYRGESLPVELPLVGAFNVENALAAAGVALAAGLPLEEIAAALAHAPQVPGRLQRVVHAPFTVALDYAHTPDALARVLRTVRPLVSGRLIVVFGAGGDRDRGKRPLMGGAAVRYADLAVVTSDNPRTEDPDDIIDDIVEGMGGQAHERVTDRREAIALALERAAPGDFVLLAGKGHEAYQVVGNERRSFDEAAIVRELLAEEVS